MRKQQKHVKYEKKELKRVLHRLRELNGSIGRNAESLKERSDNIHVVKSNIQGLTIEVADLLEKFN